MADEVEYESDPEEAKLLLKMRRRVASDDEDEDDDEGEERRGKLMVRIDDDGESGDGQGGVDDYGEYDDEGEEYYDEEGNVGILRNNEGDFGIRRNNEVDNVVIDSDGGGRLVEEESYYEEEGVEGEGRVGILRNNESSVGIHGEVDDVVGEEESDEVVDDEGNKVGQEEKKEAQPYAVPTAGAFYMHDDRFRENARGRGRRMLGGKNLWESKDEKKWGHDKFEELTMHERHYGEGRRSSRGRNRGRGRSRGAPRGDSTGSRPRSYVNDNSKYQIKDTAPRSVRGRGPRRYQPSAKTNPNAPAPQNKQYRSSLEKSSQSERASTAASSGDSSHVPAMKQQLGSSLNYASPPFYPSSSSNKEVSSTQKEDARGGPASGNVQPPLVDQSSRMPQSNSVLQGNNNIESVGMNKLYRDDSTSSVKSTNLNSASFSRSSNSSHSQHFRSHGRGLDTVPQASYQLAAASNLSNRFSSPTNPVGRNSAESKTPATMQASSHQFVRHASSVSQSSSPSEAVVPINSPSADELESLTGSIKSNMSFIGNGKVMGPSGNMIPGHGDQDLHNFLPVMQFGGQHPGGVGVPAVGMAFPGYVGNPQLGNSEMTWLPLLASAAGALGGTYCPPYFSLDGAYHVRPSAQTSVPSPASSNEVSNNSSNDERKPSQKPELVNDDFGQRQKNPRRYTEMKFDE